MLEYNARRSSCSASTSERGAPRSRSPTGSGDGGGAAPVRRHRARAGRRARWSRDRGAGAGPPCRRARTGGGRRGAARPDRLPPRRLPARAEPRLARRAGRPSCSPGELGAPVHVHNAGQAAAVAENLEGAGGKVDDLALLYAGTGLSAGVRHRRAGAARHRRHGRRDRPLPRAGRHRAVQLRQRRLPGDRRVRSGAGPLRAAGDRRRASVDAVRAATASNPPTWPRPRAAATRSRRRRSPAVGRNLGLAASWLVNAYNPAVLVFGGGLAAIGEPLLAATSRRRPAARAGAGAARRGDPGVARSGRTPRCAARCCWRCSSRRRTTGWCSGLNRSLNKPAATGLGVR